MPLAPTSSPTKPMTMNLKLEQLSAHLSRHLLPAYWVSGDEHLLVQEATDQIRATALQRGHNERHSFHADTGINWAEVYNLTQSLGLFSQQQLIEVHLGTRRPDRLGNDILEGIISNAAPETVLLISSSQLKAGDKKKSAYQALQQNGATLETPTISSTQLPQWLEQRLRQHQLTASQDALALLAERNEGNLLAAAQEVEKLALLFPQQEITPTHIQTAVGTSSRYDSFDISDAILAQDAPRALRILRGLEEEGEAPPLVLWALRRDCRVLLALTSGTKASDYVHFSKQNKYQQVAQRLGARTLMEAMAQTALVDQALKGLLPGDAWQPLESLVLRLCGRPLSRQHERI